MLGAAPPLSWTILGRIAPMPVAELALGVARLAIAAADAKQIYYARDLRPGAMLPATGAIADIGLGGGDAGNPYDALDEDLPFGWTPRDEPP